MSDAAEATRRAALILGVPADEVEVGFAIWRRDQGLPVHDELSDAELERLEAIDQHPGPWGLETESDGCSHLYDDGHGDDRADDLGGDYEPNRDDLGRFAPGSGGGAGERQSVRPWRLAFDDRDHQRRIGEHRDRETTHRAKSVEIADRMKAIRARAADASPRERASMQRKFDQLDRARQMHVGAAAEAKAARAAETKSMEEARSAHAAARREEVAGRRQAARETTIRVGMGRIAGEDAAHPVAPTAQPVELAPTPEHHFAIGVHGVPTHEPEAYTFQVPREQTKLEELSRTRPHYVHQPVHRPAPVRTAEGDAARQEHERHMRHRAAALRAASAPARAVHDTERAVAAVSLPRAEVVKHRGLLRRLLWRSGG